ncbi:DUF397 domain-containing protein [Kitasatospora sp. NPDC101183]|uniref:DUF397 domain-containing protein n=1 Tax=Kitasatospora sp. NPDC101183 TaxID=3364100 RepID=UPI0038169DCD
MEWQKSSFSGNSDDCVEVRAVGTLIDLRESDEGEVILRTTSLGFASLLQRVKVGEFDHLVG